MKTQIEITGSGLMSKMRLLRVCQTLDCEVKKLPFNNYMLTFRTKKEAVKALSEAYQYLRHDKEDWAASCGSYQRGFVLHYDAGRAKIMVKI